MPIKNSSLWWSTSECYWVPQYVGNDCELLAQYCIASVFTEECLRQLLHGGQGSIKNAMKMDKNSCGALGFVKLKTGFLSKNKSTTLGLATVRMVLSSGLSLWLKASSHNGSLCTLQNPQSLQIPSDRCFQAARENRTFLIALTVICFYSLLW